MADPSCDHLSAPNPWVLALSIFLVLGILISYLPQHLKLLSLRSSLGLSPWWVLLGVLSSIAGLTNILVLPTSQHDMACCREISRGACVAALLGVVQVGVQWVCFMAIWVLFLAFFPASGRAPAEDGVGGDGAEEEMKSRDALVVGVSCVVALLVAGLGSLFFLVMAPGQLLAWANLLGVAASVMACVQYVPQIWTTWRLGKVLSLSIITMLIQVPGAFLFAFSLYLRVGGQGWSSWLVYCVTGLFQGCLLVMAVRFWIRDRAAAKDTSSAAAAAGPTERDPLLGASRRADGAAPPKGTSPRTASGGGKPAGPLGLLYQHSPPDYSSMDSGGEPSDGEHTTTRDHR